MPITSAPTTAQTDPTSTTSQPGAVSDIQQYLNGPDLRSGPSQTIAGGEVGMTPGSTLGYAYQQFFPLVNFNKLPLTTTFKQLLDGGAITKTDIANAFGNGDPNEIADDSPLLQSTIGVETFFQGAFADLGPHVDAPASGTAAEPGGSGGTTTSSSGTTATTTGASSGGTSPTVVGQSSGNTVPTDTTTSDLLGALLSLYSGAGVSGGGSGTDSLVTAPLSATTTDTSADPSTATAAPASSHTLIVFLVLGGLAGLAYYYHKHHSKKAAA